MRFHEELNPKLWDGLILKEDVKEKLHEIADAFREYLDIPEDSILDIRITGSSASYNYTQYSDLDLHFIVDFEKVHKDCPLVEGYLWSYKSQFNDNHDISIYGVPVELYAEDSRQEAISNGVYSLMEDKWLKEPKKIPPTDNDEDVQAKYLELKEACEKCDDSEEAEKLLTKIYTMRKAGLADVGEFSTENMAFKLLRNDGIIEKLKELKKEKVDKQLSLESYQLQERDKSEYLDTVANESVLRKFSKLHKNLITPLPKSYDGDRDLEAILYYLGSKDGISARVKTPVETVIFNSKNLNHLLDDNEPERLQDLPKIKQTLQNPNLIIETQEGKTKHNYIKAFGNIDLMKAQLVVVKVLDDGTFYVTTFRLKNRKFLDKLKDGQIIYDLSDTYANMDETISYNNIITKNNKNVKRIKMKQLSLESYNESLEINNKELIKQRYINGEITAQKVQELLPNLSSLETTSWALAKFNKENNVEDAFHKVVNESLKQTYEQAFSLLVEGENLVNFMDTDFSKSFIKKVEGLYEIKTYKLKLKKAKELLMALQGYLIDEQFDSFVAKIDKFMNNSRNESLNEKLEKTDFQKLNKLLEDLNEDEQTFALAKKFNSPKEFKDSLINARDNYNVEDVVEGKDLLHLVYNNGKHIATYNNTTLELYYNKPNFKKVNEDMDKEIKINGHTYKASQNGSVINVRKIAKYDDADYYYAIYKPETAQVVYTQTGGKNKQSGVVKYNDMDKQLNEIAKHLDELNKSIKPNMVHESFSSVINKLQRFTESVDNSLLDTINKACNEELDKDVHYDFKIKKVNDEELELTSGESTFTVYISADDDLQDIRYTIEDFVDGELAADEDDSENITGTEVVGFKYDMETGEGEFEATIFFAED